MKDIFIVKRFASSYLIYNKNTLFDYLKRNKDDLTDLKICHIRADMEGIDDSKEYEIEYELATHYLRRENPQLYLEIRD